MVIRPVTLFCIVFCLTGVGYSQTPSSSLEDEPNPCQSPVLQKAQTQGLKSLKPDEIVEYWIRNWQCKRYAKRVGQDINLGYLQKQKQEEYYREAKELSGLGSCFTTVIIITILYSFVSFALLN
ncbi:MAG: hypothetical protein IIA61_03705 [Candidatus Marinimicrobia bacterium]|nr:hypothetical protein [Candidatus Neomarinimicrobiota bacterium]